MTKIIAVVLFVVTQSFLLSAQSVYSLAGKVTDKANQNIDLALVTLTHSADSSRVRAEFTDQDGSFEFGNLPEGVYMLKVQLTGFEPFQCLVDISGDQKQVSAPKIQIESSLNLLETVTVTAKIPYIERKTDRTVVHVDALIANTGSNTLEALERAPGISVDQNGGIRLKGRAGVAIYIDDKPTYLSGSELENYLKSIPASSVKQIEIMPNPPAKYEAAGNSGVINIVTKKNKTAGYHGNAVVSLQQGKYTRSNNSLNLNFNTKKVGLYAQINGGFRNSFQDLNINRYYKDAAQVRTSSFSQNSYIVKNGRSANIKTGLDYSMSEKTTVGFFVKGMVSPGGDQTDNNAIVADATQTLLRRVNADNETKNSFNNTAFNIYLRHMPDTLGSILSADADYVSYTSGSRQLFQNYLYNPDNTLFYKDQINGSIPTSIQIYAFKADYSKPMGPGAKFEAGVKSAFTQTDNEAEYSTTLDGVTTPDYNLSNRFLYDEWIHAAYLNYNKTFGSVDLQAGLRGETTRLKGHQLGNKEKPDTSFTRTYHNLFPTFYASWRVDTAQHHVISFNFGRRIDRPFFQDLNPFISPLDKFTFYGGNPGLLPTYAHNYSLSHVYKGILTTTFSYSKTTDGINETLEIRNGIYYSRPGNISNNTSYSISNDASIAVFGWYNINTYAELGHQKYKSQLYTEQLNTSGTYYYFSINNGFQMGKGWNADLRGDYQSDIVYAQLLIKSYGTLNLGVQKKVWGDRGNIKVSAQDILYTRRADGIINNLKNTDADWNSRLDTRSVTVSFSCRFGQSANKKPRHTGSGSESEQQRVKG